MSGHRRVCVAVFLVFAGLSTSPAFPNPLTDLLGLTPKEAPPPAPAQEACLLQPGNSTAPGQHWVYHFDGRRKCWFEADGATVSTKKQTRHRAAKRTFIADEENDSAPRKRKTLDARAQLLGAASAAASQSTQPTPAVIDTAPASVAAAPPAPDVSRPTDDQNSTDRAAPHHVDVETLLAASTLDENPVAPSASASPAVPDANQGHWELTVPLSGAVLIGLGLAFLIVSMLASRVLDRRLAPFR